jgi:hypothetical protein
MALESKFVPYIDPDYRKVQRTLKAEIPYEKTLVKQFDLPAYYRANVKTKDKAIYCQVSTPKGITPTATLAARRSSCKPGTTIQS